MHQITESQLRAYQAGTQRLVLLDASHKGWTVEKYFIAPHREMSVPFGIVLSSRVPVRTAHGDGHPYMTHEWALREDGHVLFYSGHYDMGYSEALTDYLARCDRFEDSEMVPMADERTAD